MVHLKSVLFFIAQIQYMKVVNYIFQLVWLFAILFHGLLKDMVASVLGAIFLFLFFQFWVLPYYERIIQLTSFPQCRWDHKLCTWLSQLCCICCSIVQRQASCCHCGKQQKSLFYRIDISLFSFVKLELLDQHMVSFFISQLICVSLTYFKHVFGTVKLQFKSQAHQVVSEPELCVYLVATHKPERLSCNF